MILLHGFGFLALVRAVTAQTTYTGCHNHSTVECVTLPGDVSLLTTCGYCYGLDGSETPLVTYSVGSLPTTFSTSIHPASVSATTTASTHQTSAVTGCHSHESAM